MNKMMDEMMLGMGDSLGSRMSPFGPSDGLFKQMDDMMSRINRGDSLGEGGGAYSCKTMMYSAKRGSDGNMHSEKFTSSTVGNSERKVRETQQAYSNSAKAIDKMSLERQMGEQGRKMVKERCRRSGEERHTDLFKGMAEDHAPRFDERWKSEAAPYLPTHGHSSRRELGGRLDPQSLEKLASRTLAGPAHHGYHSRSGRPQYAPSDAGSDVVSTVASDAGYRQSGQRSSGHRQTRTSSDSSQVGSLLRHEFVGTRSQEFAGSKRTGTRRRDNPFDY